MFHARTRQRKCMQRRRALNVELLTQLKWSVLISQIPQKCEKLAKKIAFLIFFWIFRVPGSYLLYIPSFPAMGNGELVLRCTCVLDVTSAILDVTFSVIVHALVFRLLLAVSICSLLSVCDCSYSKLLL